MSDLSKYCVHLLEKEGLGQARGGFPISNLGVGIFYNSGDFAILFFVLLAIDVCLMLYPQSPRLLW